MPEAASFTTWLCGLSSGAVNCTFTSVARSEKLPTRTVTCAKPFSSRRWAERHATLSAEVPTERASKFGGRGIASGSGPSVRKKMRCSPPPESSRASVNAVEGSCAG